jgi:hypothetical protein
LHRVPLLASACAASLLSLPISNAGAQTKVIGFEDLTTDPNCSHACVVGPNYSGMTWSTGYNEWAVYTAVASPTLNRPSSGSLNAASDESSFISFSTPGEYFNFNSIFLSEFLRGSETGGANPDFNVGVWGYRDGVVVDQTSFALSTSTMTQYDLGWSELDRVMIGGARGRILADDISITATPEPSTMLMVGTGLMGLVGIVRRRSKSKRFGTGSDARA